MHAFPRTRGGYTLAEMIGALLIGAVLLALAVPAVAHALRVRQAEAVLKNDLRNAALAFEQAYLAERRYPDLATLGERGFVLSPQVALDSQAVAGERVYLRLRHVPTGQRCALDYSRSSAVARNRPDCYGGELDRESPHPVTPEPPPAPGTDTVVIRPPSPPDTASNPLGLRSPRVSSPGGQVVPPGGSRSGAFSVTNESPVPRVFRFEVGSSGPDVVPVPEVPSPVTLAPGVPTDVTLAYTVAAGALADAASALTLRAVDAHDERWSGTGGTVVQAALALEDPVIELGGPAERTEEAGRPFVVAWTVTNRTNAARTLDLSLAADAPDHVAVLSVDGDGRVPFGPGERRTVSASLRVADASPGGSRSEVTLTGVDGAAPEHRASAALLVETRTVLRDPEWAIAPGAPMAWEEGEARDLPLAFRNRSNVSRAFCVELRSDAPEFLSPSAPARACGLRAAPGETISLERRLHALGAGTGVSVRARVEDEEVPAHRAEAAWSNTVRATRPVARWSAPSPVAMRRWATFDGSASWSPVGAPIVRYLWTWGLFMQRWDAETGRFVLAEGWGTAQDEVASPVVRRAYDLLGTFPVCLRVVDAAGRTSEPDCQPVTTIRSTVARLAWRYRGWWTDHDWCLDVWWADQCEREHGNARWEVDLRPSLGDVPLRRAYAEFRVRLHNTDDPDRPVTVSYAGNAGTLPPWTSYAFGRDAPAAVGRAQDGLWRVLRTEGTAGAGWPRDPAEHPLVLNVNLAAATGVFDGGPHWTPNDVWITLHVEDAHGRWTSATAHRDHDRAAWRRGYDTTVVAEAPPAVSVEVETLGAGKHRVRGTAESAEGRIVDTWWEITARDLRSHASTASTARTPTVDVEPRACELVTVTMAARDDRGAVGRASAYLRGETGTGCLGEGGGPIRPTDFD